MQIFTDLNENKNLAIALGFFDGVHLGHQKVIKSAVNFANKNGLKSAVITFRDHPCCHFYNVKPKYILSRKDRESKIEELGVDYLYEIEFCKNLSKLNADEYIKDVLMKYFTPKSISTGFNHYFGANKSGNAEFLMENQYKYNYEYFEIPPQKINDQIISSTLIRNYLQKGDISSANKMMGHKFKISGNIIEGQKIGRAIGFRTANILYPDELIEIPYGVYETETNFGKGITNFGIRPTISMDKLPVLETHILDFNQDIYGQKIEINFVKLIRKEQKFGSVEDLKKQIAKDIQTVKQ